jgi:Tol biopolymer transport system component
MGLAPGTRIGSYEIVTLIGAGGMGEVYRAHDTRLRRDVAIKILPAALAGDPDRLTRFEREAQALAALNHPHIAAIYGFEESGATRCLVMELVEGPTLADRIASGPVPLAETLGYARQIADALEAAHEKNIIHRDLKPANIKLTADGQVKVLDFGLAKAHDPSASGGSVSASPTLTARATQLGMILGTAAYMAPEQARGRAVDRRADVWSFGCVLYELLTGRRAFEGDDITDVLARVLERDADLSALPPATPVALRHLMARCLTKDPKARLRDIGEARIAIDEMVAGRSASTPPAPVPPMALHDRRTPRAPWIVAAVMGVAAVAAFLWPRPAPVGAGAVGLPMRVELSLPPESEFFGSPAMSADASKMAFVGVREGIRQVYLRDLRQAETKPVPGTDGANLVTFSPTGDAAAIMFTDGRIKRLTLQANVLDDVSAGADILGGLHWSADGSIYFGAVSRLSRAPSTGGAVQTVAAMDEAGGEASMSWAITTRDAKWVLFTSWRKQGGVQKPRIEAIPAGGGARHVVSDGADFVIAVTPDRVLYLRDGSLYIAPFDTSSARITGAALRLSEDVLTNPTGTPAVSLSASGALLFGATRVFSGRLVWVSTAGVERVLAAPPRAFQNPRVSPNGQSIAFSELGTIWTLDVERGATARVYAGRNGLTGFPVWADDSRLIFRTADGINTRRADGEGEPEIIKGTSRLDYPSSVSKDGKTVALTRISSEFGGDLILQPLDGSDARVVVKTKAYEGGPQFSPDGKWIAYVSNETSRMEVYLRPVDGPDRRWPVSTGGGMHPLWSRDQRHIYYRAGQEMRAVEVQTSPEVRLGASRVLFDRRYSFGPNLTIPNFSLSHDGKDLLLVREESGSGHLSLVLNWLQNVGK